MTILQRTLAALSLTTAGGAVAAVAVVLLAGSRFAGGRGLALLAYGTLGFLGLGYALGARRLSVDAERSSLPTRVRERRTVEATITLTARRRLSTILVREELPGLLGGPVTVPLPLLSGGGHTDHTYTFTPKLRGVYPVGPLVATWNDPFGLTARRAVLAEATEIIVHPRVEPAHDRVLSRQWEDPPIRPPVSRPWPVGFEFYGLRDYSTGDDPRRIVWRATARSDRVLVRESEQGITDRVLLVCDTDDEHHSPGDVSETLENCVRALASLGVKHLTDGFAVSLDTSSARVAHGLRGRPAQIPLLDAFARVRRERAPLAGAIDRLLTDTRRDSHVVLATPHLEDAAASRLRLLLDRRISVLLVLAQWEGSDLRAAHRARALGCTVVEVRGDLPIERLFRRVVTARR